MRTLRYIVFLLLLIGCDTVEPVDNTLLVVEGFLNTDAPLPEIHVRRTLPPREPYSYDEAAVADASVQIVIDGAAVHYQPDQDRPGTYVPSTSDVRPAGGRLYTYFVRWQDAEIEAKGVLPRKIRIDDVEIDAPDEPVSAVFLDSLALSDSLATGAYTGYIYPVDVTVHWDDHEDLDDDSWVRLQLRPYTDFSSPVIDLFLKSDEIMQEEQATDQDGRRSWTGVYAVGVENPDDPLPDHLLRVSVVRSGEDYARFAASRSSPGRREPISNLDGAAGILTAISVDSLHVRITQLRE